MEGYGGYGGVWMGMEGYGGVWREYGDVEKRAMEGSRVKCSHKNWSLLK